MSIRGRATLAAVALALGLLVVVGASSFKSTALIKHQRAVTRGEPSEAPSTSGYHGTMVVGWIVAVGGAVLLGLTLRDMTRQIGDIQSRVEAQMRMEAAAKRDPKASP